nr:MAG TPA: hypothetical protein [Caudoviricetes sp.]
MERGYQKLNNSRRLKEWLEYVRCIEADEGSRLYSRILLLFYSS